MNLKEVLTEKSNLIIWIIVLAIFAVIPTFAGNYYISLLFLVFIYATIGQMWNFLAANVGAISLGQQIFIGMGGYLVAITTIFWGLPIFVGAILGALVSAGIALVLAYPLFRMRGIYFAIGSWMAAASIYAWFNNWDYVQGGYGLIVRAGFDLSMTTLYYPAFILAFIAIFASYYILRSKLGYGLRAIGDVDSITPAMGINRFRLQQLAFAFAAVLTAFAGSLYFLHEVYITPGATFQIDWIVQLIFVTIVGGIGMPLGPFLGSFVLIIMNHLLFDFPSVYLLAQGVVIVLVVLFLPQGILGVLRERLSVDILSIREEV